MNKKLSIIFAAALFVVATTAARADDWTSNLHPYIGADYQFMHYDYSNVAGINGNSVLPQSLSAGDVHVGVRPFKYVGAELGYFLTNEPSKTTDGISAKIRGQGGTLDLLGYLPIYNQLDLIGTAGVLWDDAKLTVTGLGSYSKSEIDGRFGGGLQINLTPNINIRGLARYQTADFSGFADHALVYDLGVNYSF